MVLKRFCDICGSEIIISFSSEPCYGLSDMANGKHYEICEACGRKITNFIRNLKQEHSDVGALIQRIHKMKYQRTIDEFFEDVNPELIKTKLDENACSFGDEIQY